MVILWSFYKFFSRVTKTDLRSVLLVCCCGALLWMIVLLPCGCPFLWLLVGFLLVSLVAVFEKVVFMACLYFV